MSAHFWPSFHGNDVFLVTCGYCVLLLRHFIMERQSQTDIKDIVLGVANNQDLISAIASRIQEAVHPHQGADSHQAASLLSSKGATNSRIMRTRIRRTEGTKIYLAPHSRIRQRHHKVGTKASIRRDSTPTSYPYPTPHKLKPQ